MNNNVYTARRGILKALKEASSCRMTAEVLVELKLNTELMYAPAEMIREEWQNLKAHGYIEAIPGFNGEYCEITKVGLEQLSIEFPQHPFIHGPGAIK